VRAHVTSFTNKAVDLCLLPRQRKAWGLNAHVSFG